jgi:hypothetical protein
MIHLRSYFGCWLFWLSVLAESVFSQYKVDFVNQCVIFFIFFVSVNCYVSWIVCVAICVSRSHFLYFFFIFSPVVYFFQDRIHREWARGKKGEKRKVWVPLFSHYLKMADIKTIDTWNRDVNCLYTFLISFGLKKKEKKFFYLERIFWKFYELQFQCY